MSHTLNLEVSDQVYDAIRAQGDATGKTPAQVVAAALECHFPVTNGAARRVDSRSEFEKESARLRFEQQFGTVDLGTATGDDNTDIDADLEREYADDHEAS